MKKMSLVMALATFGFASLASAQSYIYFQNPTYCQASWQCDVVSQDWDTALDFCEDEAFARTPATVYQSVNGKMTFKGYGCYDPLYAGGGN